MKAPRDLGDTAQRKLVVTEPLPRVFSHGSKLRNKVASDSSLEPLLKSYHAWKDKSLAIENREVDDVKALTDLLNEYKGAVEAILDARPNSAQEVLQPSIIEEFFEYLFCKLDSSLKMPIPIREPASGYLELVFHPKSLSSLVSTPEYTARAKDHDFVIGGKINLTIQGHFSREEKRNEVVIPAVAFECKRYLERNMLDECAGTADMVKRATPYCRYVVVAEYLKMDEALPELTKIDQIFVLRKQKNSDRIAEDFVQKPIDGQLVWELYQETIQHLRRIWWDPESVLKTGKLFDR